MKTVHMKENDWIKYLEAKGYTEDEDGNMYPPVKEVYESPEEARERIRCCCIILGVVGLITLPLFLTLILMICSGF